MSESQGGGTARTALLTILAMLAFAGTSLFCRLALRDTEIDAASFTAIRLASGALVLAALLVLRGKRPTAGGSWPMAAMLFAYAMCFSFAYRDLTAATGALLLFVSCPRIFWTPICPTGGIHDEVEHEPNRNQRCE